MAKDYAKALKDRADAKTSEMAKGFTDVTPEKWDGMASESKDHFPDFTLDAADIPEAKDWDIGEMYTIEIKVKMVGNNENINGDDGSHRFRFEIHGVKGGGEVEEKGENADEEAAESPAEEDSEDESEEE